MASDLVLENVRTYFIAGDFEREGEVCVEWRGPKSDSDPTIRWAVTRGSWCLSRSGKWNFEPRPSSRTEAWLTRHRWESFEEACEAARKAHASLKRKVDKQYALAKKEAQ